KRFPRQDLQGLQIDAAAFVELEVPPGKVLADDPDQSHRAEKARRQGSVAGRATQKPGIFGFWSFDRIERGRADNQNAHGKFNEMIRNRNQGIAGRSMHSSGSQRKALISHSSFGGEGWGEEAHKAMAVLARAIRGGRRT